MRRQVLIIAAGTMALLYSTMASAACDEPGERSAVLLSVAKAEQAFQQMDIDGFQAARDQALTELPCLVDPLQPADAARIHVLEALDAFTRNDEAGTVNALRSAVQADPVYALPAELVPEGHALRLQLRVASTVTDSAPRPGCPFSGHQARWKKGGIEFWHPTGSTLSPALPAALPGVPRSPCTGPAMSRSTWMWK